MIIQGSKGSINVYHKDLFISSFPLSNKRTIEWYEDNANKALIRGIKIENISLKTMIVVFKEILEYTYQKKINKKRIDSEQHQLFFMSILSLIKLKQIEHDDHILIMKKKFCKKY
tara:strand:+ start:129 stop:473 length:345 start_codon:yes stop_codon:yes gene_type:complete